MSHSVVVFVVELWIKKEPGSWNPKLFRTLCSYLLWLCDYGNSLEPKTMSHLVVVFVVTAEHDQTAPGDWERVEDLLSCFPPHVGILEKRKPCIWRHEQLNHKKTCSAAFRHTLWSYHRKRKPCIWRHELLNLRAVEDLLSSFPPHVGILEKRKPCIWRRKLLKY